MVHLVPAPPDPSTAPCTCTPGSQHCTPAPAPHPRHSWRGSVCPFELNSNPKQIGSSQIPAGAAQCTWPGGKSVEAQREAGGHDCTALPSAWQPRHVAVPTSHSALALSFSPHSHSVSPSHSPPSNCGAVQQWLFDGPRRPPLPAPGCMHQSPGLHGCHMPGRQHLVLDMLPGFRNAIPPTPCPGHHWFLTKLC